MVIDGNNGGIVSLDPPPAVKTGANNLIFDQNNVLFDFTNPDDLEIKPANR